MTTETEIRVYTPDGATQLTSYGTYIKLEYGRAENKIGWLKLDLDPSQLDHAIWDNPTLDTRIEPWRRVDNLPPYLDGGTTYFLRDWNYITDTTGKRIFHIECYDANYLLSGRIIRALVDPHAWFTAKEADDAMKEIITYQFGANADDSGETADLGISRILSTYLTVQANATLGPQINKRGNRWRPVSDVLNEICDLSLEKGTYLVYDVVWTSPGMLEFRTYTGQRGIHHGIKQTGPGADTIVVSRERGNFEVPNRGEAHTDEATLVYALGAPGSAAGSGSDGRKVRLAALHNTASIFALRELYIDASSAEADGDAIQEEALRGLITHKRKKTLVGRLVDIDGCRYGVHYNYGDILYAEEGGFGSNVHFNALHVTVEHGQEFLDNQLKVEL